MSRVMESFRDTVSLTKMDILSGFGRLYLPKGFWGDVPLDVEETPKLCLTFDDGPDPKCTPRLLDILSEFDVKATFFLIGDKVRRYPDLVKRVYDAGHTIANHSFSHCYFPHQELTKIQQELVTTNFEVEQITGEKPQLFRPPYGVLDKRSAEVLDALGMNVVYWGSVPEDWSLPSSASVVRRVLSRLYHGNLIVLHEEEHLAKQTVVSAREIIGVAQDAGYEFVTVPQLMDSRVSLVVS